MVSSVNLWLCLPGWGLMLRLADLALLPLQGSERARLSTEDPARAGAVLMDENLRRSNLSSPLLIDPVAYARCAAITSGLMRQELGVCPRYRVMTM